MLTGVNGDVLLMDFHLTQIASFINFILFIFLFLQHTDIIPGTNAAPG